MLLLRPDEVVEEEDDMVDEEIDEGARCAGRD